ncbi:ECF RNA polymerase sigma factor SigK [Georgenia sp. Z1344]|uniref:ECF RNA polymerase sigma factor SigK n=1 Tax=Georgenia sp. Z1344 TaxID=3416706 RepID=UPI003CEFF069
MTDANGSRGDETRAERARRLADLVARVATGDQAAFAELYDQTAPMVHGTCLRVLRDPDLAAEVTQEVMLEVWTRPHRFDASRGTVPAWLATMAHRRAIDRVRAVQAQRDRDETAGVRGYGRPYDDVSETVERRDDRELLMECLGSLTDVQRDAVERAYFGGRTYREVARDLGAALPTVKSRIRDGLARLRTCLGVA